MNTRAFYAVMFLGIALFVATPFVAMKFPLALLVVAPLVLCWGVWVINSYWRWVRSLGK